MHTLTLHVQGTKMQPDVFEKIISGATCIIGGGALTKIFQNIQDRRLQKDKARQDFTIKITDEASDIRHELTAENRALREAAMKNLEEKHRVELDLVREQAKNAELERRLISLGQRFDGVVKLRGMIQEGADKVELREDLPHEQV